MGQRRLSGQDTLGICLETVSGVDAGAVSVSPSSRTEESRGQYPGGQRRFREQGESQPALGPKGRSGRRGGWTREVRLALRTNAISSAPTVSVVGEGRSWCAGLSSQMGWASSPGAGTRGQPTWVGGGP